MEASWSDDLQLVNKCCNLAFKAHHSGTDFSKDNSGRSSDIFAFRGSSSVEDWFSGDQLISESMEYSTSFPSLKVLGSGDSGILNRAFLQRFDQIMGDSQSQLRKEIERSLSLTEECSDKFPCCLNNKEAHRSRKKKIVFTGHSNGGAIAILTTIWSLENYRRDPKAEVLCITFGSPLVGDKIVGHAIRREGWSPFFKNFVLPSDLIPRLHFSPRDEITGDQLPSILQSWTDPRKSISHSSASSDPPETNELSKKIFNVVLQSTFAIASYDSCVLRCSVGGSSLLEAVNKIVVLSPYRPFGSFYFCCSKGNVVKVENHDAVMQMLFYSLQLQDSSGESNAYETYEIKQIVPLSDLQTIPLSANDDHVNSALNILDLDMEARLNLIAAGEMERVREKNLATLNWYKNDINACLSKLQTYCTNCDNGIGYYDAFKVQQDKADFEANVTRLELIGYWEEVRELLKAFELPDLFEADRKWVELGTRIRFLVEPIDIANFYRHDKNEETNLYTTKSQARPNYYRYPERWLQHMRRFALENDPIMTNKEWNLDSCFWARVENMCIGIKRNGFDSEKDEVSRFEEEVEKWLTEGALREHELKRPTFKNWWAMLPEEHKINSCIRNRMDQ